MQKLFEKRDTTTRGRYKNTYRDKIKDGRRPELQDPNLL